MKQLLYISLYIFLKWVDLSLVRSSSQVRLINYKNLVFFPMYLNRHLLCLWSFRHLLVSVMTYLLENGVVHAVALGDPYFVGRNVFFFIRYIEEVLLFFFCYVLHFTLDADFFPLLPSTSRDAF